MYRRDLDGMRAVAVLLVILYHYGIAPVTGGYLGVDVFFVLSGFFITRLILRAHTGGAFSFASFYERRARRLLPSALLVLTLTSALMFVIAPPGELVDYVQSVFASLFFFANFHFKDTFTYFGPAAETQPLLHFWSLAVEEQFYFVIPALLLVLLKWGRKAALIGLIALGAGSLALSSWQVHAQPPDAFFHLPSRGWELIAGCVLAFAPVPLKRAGNGLRELVMLLALGVIAWQAIVLTRSSPFPGLNAVPAIMATMGVILFGHGDTRGGLMKPATWLLANPVMNWIGRLSYSLYLWHWPVLVLYRLRIGEPDTLFIKLALVAVTVALSALGYYFIEQPVRQRRLLNERRGLTLVLGSAATLIVLFGSQALLTNGFASRAPESVLTVEAGLKRQADSACEIQGIYVEDIKTCALGISPVTAIDPAAITTLLIGDSHARALLPFFDIESRRFEADMLVLYKGDCLPVIGVDFHKGHRLKCPQMNTAMLALTDTYPALQHVFITARWERLTEPKRNGQAERIGLSEDGGLVVHDTTDRLRALENGLLETVALLAEQGISVTLIGQVPSYNEPPRRCIIRALWGGLEPEMCGLEQAHAMTGLSSSNTLLRQVASRFETVDVWLPSEALCRGTRCEVIKDNRSLYRDDNHLSVAGAEYLAELMPMARWPDGNPDQSSTPHSP